MTIRVKPHDRSDTRRTRFSVMVALALIATSMTIAPAISAGGSSRSPWSERSGSRARLSLAVRQAGFNGLRPIKIQTRLPATAFHGVAQYRVYVISVRPTDRCPRYPAAQKPPGGHRVKRARFSTTAPPTDRNGEDFWHPHIRACGYLVRTTALSSSLVVVARAQAAGQTMTFVLTVVVFTLLVLAGIIVGARTAVKALRRRSARTAQLPPNGGRPLTAQMPPTAGYDPHGAHAPNDVLGRTTFPFGDTAGRQAPPVPPVSPAPPTPISTRPHPRCTVCGKLSYATEAEASTKVANSQDMFRKGKPVKVLLTDHYYDTRCGVWHTTSQAPRVL